MLDLGSILPDVPLVDIRGKQPNASIAEMATTGVPVLLVVSALSPLCRDLSKVFAEFTRLDEGDYTVWALVQGMPDSVEDSFPAFTQNCTTFAFLPGWDGLSQLQVGAYPSLIVADRAGKVTHAVEGWDRVAWQSVLHDLQGMLGWQKTVLNRKLPGPQRIPVRQTAGS